MPLFMNAYTRVYDFFFFQAEDGIRDLTVTGVQTCALPICTRGMAFSPDGKTLAMSGITNVSNAFAGIGNPIVLLANWEDGKEVVQYGSKAKDRKSVV